MVLLPSLPAIEVTIKVNGATAREYEPPKDETYAMSLGDFDFSVPDLGQDLPYVVKHIESIPGAQYSFRIVKEQRFRSRSHHIAAQASRDGHELGLVHDDKGTRKQSQRWDAEISAFWSGTSEGGYHAHTFEFAAIDIGMLSVVYE